ncbi:hypothetical protein RND81_12G109200 [Saponaria officinalis]|uniref:Transposase n=1 Tax=Saponaria officinalis TaxID=3572 RepID=A0AAW1H937_SAPOF
MSNNNICGGLTPFRPPISSQQPSNSIRQHQEESASSTQQQQRTSVQHHSVAAPNMHTPNNTLEQQQTVAHLFLRQWIERRLTNPFNEVVCKDVAIPTPIARLKQKRLTNLERRMICQRITLNFQGGKLKHGLINQLSSDYTVSRVTITTIWKTVQTQLKDGKLADFSRKYQGRKSTRVIDLEKVRNIDLEKRMNIRDLALELKLPCTTVWRIVQKGKIRAHTSSIRPTLSNENKLARLQWVLSKICSSTLNGNLVFEAMFEVVHIDEK